MHHPFCLGCDISAPGFVSEAQNPVTRSIVRLHPPFEITSEAAFDDFARRFNAWCQAAWDLARIDPDFVDLTFAHPPGNPPEAARMGVRHLAGAQRYNAQQLLKAVRRARSFGVSWRGIAGDLGISYASALRQEQAGSPIVVVRPYQRRSSRWAKGGRT